MLLANKFFDLVIGVDFHTTTSPPFNPVHPFIGFTLDISAYIPFIGATTFINKVPYGNSGTMGTLGTKAHIPLVGSFAMAPMVAHESTNFFGSMNTFVEGMRLSGAGFMVMSCNDVGVPLSMQPGTKGKKPKASLFAPTSVTIPIPKGSPVMVGGPYVPDLTAMLKSMAMGFGMGCLMKGVGGSAKKITKLANAKNKQARDLISGIGNDTSLPRGKVKKNVVVNSNTPNKPPATKPIPPFKRNPKHTDAEFNKQLKAQQDGINNMKTKEWLQNREDFKNRNKTEYSKSAKKERDIYRESVRQQKIDEGLENGLSKQEATINANEYMKGKAALHNPDGVAGGKVDDVTGLGDRGVNSSIGSQWDKGRAASIESQVKSQYGIPPKTISDIPDNAIMNVELI